MAATSGVDLAAGLAAPVPPLGLGGALEVDNAGAATSDAASSLASAVAATADAASSLAPGDGLCVWLTTTAVLAPGAAESGCAAAARCVACVLFCGPFAPSAVLASGAAAPPGAGCPAGAAAAQSPNAAATEPAAELGANDPAGSVAAAALGATTAAAGAPAAGAELPVGMSAGWPADGSAGGAEFAPAGWACRCPRAAAGCCSGLRGTVSPDADGLLCGKCWAPAKVLSLPCGSSTAAAECVVLGGGVCMHAAGCATATASAGSPAAGDGAVAGCAPVVAGGLPAADD